MTDAVTHIQANRELNTAMITHRAATPAHPYNRDPQSGAGNCVCGMALRHRRHWHEYMPAAGHPDICTCALPKDAPCHR